MEEGYKISNSSGKGPKGTDCHRSLYKVMFNGDKVTRQGSVQYN